MNILNGKNIEIATIADRKGLAIHDSAINKSPNQSTPFTKC
jgi:hypothetical protein